MPKRWIRAISASVSSGNIWRRLKRSSLGAASGMGVLGGDACALATAGGHVTEIHARLASVLVVYKIEGHNSTQGSSRWCKSRQILQVHASSIEWIAPVGR